MKRSNPYTAGRIAFSPDIACVCFGRGFFRVGLYLRLSPMSAAAASPARIPAAGAGVDVSAGGWSIGEDLGCAGVGSSPAGTGAGSAAAVKPDGCTAAAAGIWRGHTQ